MYRSDHELEYEHYNGQKTDFDLQFYQDPEGREAPIFFVREAPGNKGPSLDTARNAIAQDFAEKYDLKPEQVRWVERERDGTLREYRFDQETQLYRPYAQEMPLAEYLKGEKEGVLLPKEVTMFTSKATKEPLKPAEFNEQVGSEHTLDFKQSHGFQQMREPSHDQDDLSKQTLPDLSQFLRDADEFSRTEQEIQMKLQQEAQTPRL